jgi:hypothetical protein
MAVGNRKLISHTRSDNNAVSSGELEQTFWGSLQLFSILLGRKEMVRKIIAIFVLLLVSICLGCAMPMRTPVMGGIYMGVQAGESVAGTAGATKTGEACAMSILGMVAIGDASIEAAAKNGGIEQISYVDQDMTGILGVYGQHCTVVHGN